MECLDEESRWEANVSCKSWWWKVEVFAEGECRVLRGRWDMQAGDWISLR